MKKITVWFLAVVALTTTFAHAAALDQKMVSANAKWLIHADFEGFKASKVGGAIFKMLEAGPIDQVNGQISSKLGVKLDVTKIKGITAYGTEFDDKKDNDGVVLINAGQNVVPALEALLKKEDDDVAVSKTSRGGLNLYSVENQGYVSQLKGNLLAISQNADSVVNASKVLAGQVDSLAKKSAFNGYTSEVKPVIVVLAEGFNKQEGIPQPAQFLKASEGLKLAIGESGKNIQIALDLKTPDEQSTTQISQALNGMLALFRLNQDNPDLTKLLNAMSVNTADNRVSLNIAFPIEEALKKLAEAQ